MTKKILNLSFFIILLCINGCGYKPILSGSDYNFSIKVGNSSGNEEINSNIENKLKVLKGIKKTFKVDIISKETKSILWSIRKFCRKT